MKSKEKTVLAGRKHETIKPYLVTPRDFIDTIGKASSAIVEDLDHSQRHLQSNPSNIDGKRQALSPRKALRRAGRSPLDKVLEQNMRHNAAYR